MESTAISSDEEDALSLSDLPLENQLIRSSLKPDIALWGLGLSDSGCRWSESNGPMVLKWLPQVLAELRYYLISIRVTSKIQNQVSTDSKVPTAGKHVENSSSRMSESKPGPWSCGVGSDLKVRRNTVSRNSKVVKNKKVGQVSKKQQDLNKGFIEKRIMGMYSGCKCSANVVETVPLNNVVFIKRNKKGEKKNGILVSAMEEKKLQHELKMKKMKEKGREK
ncbi:hypothetical protein GOBAR_AA16510 [Gossypium barbadense]|uniref:Uncharacterized protein n=1 Tax=Gossypium barbadense TaxID=3634 RepID=A0A2P5XLF9_GOSBA|nr:hypothetical protein GOBAR_AA16510 [Gossypium barbadense]